MAAPTITITVKGSSASSPLSESVEDHLYMMYVQAVNGEHRYQWVYYPPKSSALGLNEEGEYGAGGILLERHQTFVGNRAKWFHNGRDVAALLGSRMADLTSAGYSISRPVLVRLELDDYLETHGGATSHKSMRAVTRAIEPLGYSVK